MIINDLWLIFSLVVYFLATVIVGSWILRLFKVDLKQKYHLSLEYFTGQIVWSGVALLINLLLPSPWNLAVITGLIGILLIKNFKYLTICLKNLFPVSKIDSPFLLVLLVILALFFFRAFVRPYSWDDVIYHFPIVKEFSSGAIHFPFLSNSPMLDFYSPVSIFYGNLPYSSESFASILYLISFNNIHAVQILYFVNFLIFLVFIYKYLEINCNLKNIYTKYLILILLSTLLDVSLIVSTGYVDINVAVYQLLGVIFISLAIKNKNISFIYLATAFFGYSIGIKYTALYVLPLFAIYYIIFISTNRLSFKTVPFLLKTLLIFVLAGGYWYLKNLILYNNPVYPLYFGHFGITDEYYKLIVDTQINLGLPVSLHNLKIYVVNNYKDQLGLLIACPAIVLLWLNGKLKDITSFSLILFGTFLFIINFTFGSQIVRFNILSSFVLIILSAKFFDASKSFSSVCLVALLIFTGFNPLQHSVWQAIGSDVAANLIGKSNTIEKNKIGCAVDIVKYVKEHNFAHESVVNLWDPYAAMIYSENKVFADLHGAMVNDDFVFSNEISFIYSNEKYKNNFLANPEFHRGIKPIDRDLLEKSEVKTKIYSSGECVLYEI